MAEILGWIATFLFTILIIPQIIKTIKIKKVDEVSLGLYILLLLANIVALVYAILINQPPLLIKYVLGIITTTFYIGLYAYYSRRKNV